MGPEEATPSGAACRREPDQSAEQRPEGGDQDTLRRLFQSSDISPFQFYSLLVEQSTQLHSDVWNGVRFFLTANAVLVAVIATVSSRLIQDTGVHGTSPAGEGATVVTALILCILGAFLTGCVAIPVLKKTRRNYLECQMKKFVIEQHLDLFRQLPNTGGTLDLRVPWTMTPAHFNELCSKKPEQWKLFGWNTITFLLLMTYVAFLLLYGTGIVVFALCLS